MINHVAENHSDELMPSEAAEHASSSTCRDNLRIRSSISDFPVGDNNTGGLFSVEKVRNHVFANHLYELMPLEATEHAPSSPCRDDLSIRSSSSNFRVTL